MHRIQHRGHGGSTEDVLPELSGEIIACALAVHSALGPGLLERVYEACLCREFSARHIPFVRQAPMPIEYGGVKLACGYRIDLVVRDSAIVEVKAVESILPVHRAQLLTYLRLSRMRVGLLINFNVRHLRHGIQRIAN